jgi:hypothetical protein
MVILDNKFFEDDTRNEMIETTLLFARAHGLQLQEALIKKWWKLTLYPPKDAWIHVDHLANFLKIQPNTITKKLMNGKKWRLDVDWKKVETKKDADVYISITSFKSFASTSWSKVGKQIRDHLIVTEGFLPDLNRATALVKRYLNETD